MTKIVVYNHLSKRTRDTQPSSQTTSQLPYHRDTLPGMQPDGKKHIVEYTSRKDGSRKREVYGSKYEAQTALAAMGKSANAVYYVKNQTN